MSVRGRTVLGRDSIREGRSVVVFGCSRCSLREAEDTRRGKYSESGRWLLIAVAGSLEGVFECGRGLSVDRKCSPILIIAGHSSVWCG